MFIKQNLSQLNIVVKNKLSQPQEIRRLLRHFVEDIGLVGLTYICSLQPNILYMGVGLVTLPILYFRAFSLMHDSVHSSVSKNKIINNMTGILFGTFCFLPFWPWRGLHLEHHQWAGNIDKDPVMKIVKDYETYKPGKKRLIDFSWNNWLPLVAFLQNVLFWRECVNRIIKFKKTEDYYYNVLSVVVPLAIYATVFSLASAHMSAVILLAVPIYLMMVEVINLPHHLSLPQETGDRKLSFLEQYRISRSCHYPKFIASFCLNNFNYHTEHHMFPFLPWYQLTEIREIIKPYLGTEYNESIASHWIVENKRKPIRTVLKYKQDIVETKKAA